MNKYEGLLQASLANRSESVIETLGRYIDAHIESNWRDTLQNHADKLQRAYEEAGDMAYGTYLNLLLGPVHKEMKGNGLQPSPRLPGDFDISREWGNEDESDQQRWMWSAIHDGDGSPLGTIVLQIFHDHTQFRLPRRPGILALSVTGKEEVVRVLSQKSASFEQALEFTEEYKLYLQSLNEEQNSTN
ncbi:DUF6022 family protein [Paenibacillus paeoniae]|uniref:Uncharacterized protein n=1 Tax=Paenibacillus paeoniae TaxID=2292705 RepID=A0A371PN89_9BACL|nr:DUF6022 family protein [Paenibacillus paeoniae]REK77641.1 hypothetical protein DX130_11790 [Paenibacillus paeoniae]